MKSNGVRVAFVVLLSTATAQAEEIRSLEIDGGGSVSYVLAPKASALETSKLLHRHLSAGEIEAAALLSNAPKRRFEVFRDYRQAVGEEEFKKLFASYLTPETRLVAEVAIDRHRRGWKSVRTPPVTPAASRGEASYSVLGSASTGRPADVTAGVSDGRSRSPLAPACSAWRSRDDGSRCTSPSSSGAARGAGGRGSRGRS